MWREKGAITDYRSSNNLRESVMFPFPSLGYDQWFRIDWFDARLRQPLNVHYHVFRELDAHPGPHRVIWTP